jgi:glycosidase
MPDRFANGDPSNDTVAGYREAADRANPDGRHGGDLAGLRARLGYIADMGFTQLWLTPVQQNDQPRGSYHTARDHGFLPRGRPLRRQRGIRAPVSEAHSRSIGVIWT